MFILTAQVYSNEQSVNSPAENFAVEVDTTPDQQASVLAAQTKAEGESVIKQASNSSKG